MRTTVCTLPRTCAIPTITITSSQSYLSYDSTTTTITASPTALNEVGTTTINYTLTFGSISVEKTFDLTITSLCPGYTPTITLETAKFPNQSYSLGSNAVKLAVDTTTTTTDVSASQDLSSCGAYTA